MLIKFFPPKLQDKNERLAFKDLKVNASNKLEVYIYKLRIDYLTHTFSLEDIRLNRKFTFIIKGVLPCLCLSKIEFRFF